MTKRAETKVIEFTSAAFHHRSKNNFWFVGVSLLILAVLIIAFYYHDYLTGLVGLALGVAIMRVNRLTPETKKVRLSASGVTWGDRRYGFHQLRAFWVAQVEGRINVYLERLNLATSIALTVPEHQAKEVVSFLSEHLPFHHHKNEPFSERLGRFLGI